MCTVNATEMRQYGAVGRVSWDGIAAAIGARGPGRGPVVFCCFLGLWKPSAADSTHLNLGIVALLCAPPLEFSPRHSSVFSVFDPSQFDQARQRSLEGSLGARVVLRGVLEFVDFECETMDLVLYALLFEETYRALEEARWIVCGSGML